jgi:hypothetical protein
MKNVPWQRLNELAALVLLSLATTVFGGEKSAGLPNAPKAQANVSFPPMLPGGVRVVTDTSAEFLKPTATLKPDVAIAKTPPKIDFAFFPAQDYPGNPWSAWGDSLALNGKYYASIGDHLAPGNAFVFEYDPVAKTFRQLVDVRQLLGLPAGHYTPGKIHSRLDAGEDGWIYFSTHRGSTRITTDEFHYKGDWILRVQPHSGRAEIIAQGPVPKHCIPCSVVDPMRLIFYGGTAPGVGKDDDEGIQFFAYDLKNRKLLYSGPNGPSRYMIFSKSTGRVYYTTGKSESALMRFDPKIGKPERIDGDIGIRAATEETPQGMVYTVSSGQGRAEATLYAFDVKTEKPKALGPAAVGTQQYITSIDADPTGRFLYYVPGAHGGSELDGCPVVQFDTQTGRRKVLAFLHPFYATKYGCTLKGTFSSAIDPSGDKLFITWNNSRGTKVWDSCVLTVVHIPRSERTPSGQ